MSHTLCNRDVIKSMVDDLDKSCTRKLNRELKRKEERGGKSKTDIAEAFSPPRMAIMATKLGFKAGFSLDLTTQDEQGKP